MEIVKRVLSVIVLGGAFALALYIIFCATFWLVVWTMFKVWK